MQDYYDNRTNTEIGYSYGLTSSDFEIEYHNKIVIEYLNIEEYLEITVNNKNVVPGLFTGLNIDMQIKKLILNEI